MILVRQAPSPPPVPLEARVVLGRIERARRRPRSSSRSSGPKPRRREIAALMDEHGVSRRSVYRWLARGLLLRRASRPLRRPRRSR